MATQEMSHRKKPFNTITILSITGGIFLALILKIFLRNINYEYMANKSLLFFIKSLWGIPAYFIFSGLHRWLDKKFTALLVILPILWIVFFILKAIGYLFFG